MLPKPAAKLPLIDPGTTIRAMLKLMDATGTGIALAVDDQRHLIAALTDGDVRRAILDGIDLEWSVSQLLAMRDARGITRPPVTASITNTDEELRALMISTGVRQIPILDLEDRVVGLATESDYVKSAELGLDGFIMAGGFGKRLMPLTKDVPKPMLPVNGKPLLEHIVEKLRNSGIKHVNISTHYLAETITGHFRDGKDFGVEIEYVSEDKPMGTAGALSKFVSRNDPLLVVNGDVLTSVNYRAMLDFHREHSADMTIAVCPHELQIPFGVLTIEGIDAKGIVEKPKVRNFVNAGIYLLQPAISGMVPSDRKFDMTDLIDACISAGKKVICFPIREYWLDVGQIEQYERASVDSSAGAV